MHDNKNFKWKTRHLRSVLQQNIHHFVSKIVLTLLPSAQVYTLTS